MFNKARRCLAVTVRIRGSNFSMRSVHEDVIPSPKRHSRASTWCSSDAAYKRFFCHATINEPVLTSTDLRNQQQKLDQQKLDEFLSDPENKKRFEILELEVDVLRHSAERVPSNIRPRDWLMLLNTMNKIRRKKYLQFLWRNEKVAENIKAKKESRRAEYLAKKEAESAEEDTGELKYGLLHNTMFMRIYETTMSRFYNGRLINCMMFEPKIVFDCDYESNMNHRELHNCAKQMSLAFASIRVHANPMHLYFCNFNQDGALKKHLLQNIPSLLDNDFPVTMTPQSYLEIFPKNQLVYLTPHCRENLYEYDPEMIYIIGALVDKSDSQPLSLAKAKREGIRMAKFPIDRYLDWGASSSKSLTLDQSLKIMLDLRHTRDWKEALKNVPTRKLKPARENMLRYKLQKSKCFPVDAPEIQEPKTLEFTFQNRKRN